MVVCIIILHIVRDKAILPKVKFYVAKLNALRNNARIKFPSPYSYTVQKTRGGEHCFDFSTGHALASFWVLNLFFLRKTEQINNATNAYVPMESHSITGTKMRIGEPSSFSNVYEWRKIEYPHPQQFINFKWTT